MKLLKDYQVLSLVRRLRPVIEKDHTWRNDAACLEEDPELFFPIGTTGPAIGQAQNAREVCDGCDVEAKCLVWALTQNINEGVWGGTTEAERRALKRRMKRARDTEDATRKMESLGVN